MVSTSGSCECGTVQYQLMGLDHLHVYACHCLNCQTRSGSAFAEHMMIHHSAFSCDETTESYRRVVDDIQFEEVFCGTCHTRLFNRNSALPDMIFLRAGTLSESQSLEPIAHIWTRRKQRWLSLPDGIPTFDESPTPEQFGAVISEAEQRRTA